MSGCGERLFYAKSTKNVTRRLGQTEICKLLENVSNSCGQTTNAADLLVQYPPTKMGQLL